MEINLTKRAQEELKKVMKFRKEKKALRIYLAGHDWCGPSFGLALDEYRKGDNLVEICGQTILYKDHLIDNLGSLIIDYTDDGLRKGFTVKSNKIIGSY